MDLKRFILIALFTVSALSAAPRLQLSTTALGPFNIAGGASGPAQTVTVTNAGDGTLNLSVTSTAPWLVASVAAGRISVTLNTGSLAPGSYTEFVLVNAPGAIDAPQNISVTVQVGGVPSSLELYATPNGGKASAQVLARSTATATASTADGRPWLAVSLNGQGSFNFFYPYLINVTTQPGQGEGNYNGTVAISGASNASDNKNVAVVLHVTSQPIAQFTGASPLILYGSASGPKITQNVPVTNIGLGTLALTGGTGTTSSGGNWLSASAVDNGTIAVVADPAGLQAGVYRGTVSLTGNAANNSTNTLPIEFVVGQSAGPVISFGGVVDNTIGKPNVAPGSIASIYGQQLASSTPVSATALPLSTTLGNVQVLVNGIPAPVYYTSAGQLNFQVPYEVQPGPATVTVSYNGITGNTVATTIQAVAPRILRLNLANYGIIVNTDATFPMPATPGFNTRPARIGDALTIYAIGLGPTNPAAASGTGAPASEPLARTHTPVVYFGGGFASPPMQGQVLYSGLTPGFVGLYQINVVVPPGTPSGDAIGLVFTLDGATSNNVNIAIGK